MSAVFIKQAKDGTICFIPTAHLIEPTGCLGYPSVGAGPLPPTPVLLGSAGAGNGSNGQLLGLGVVQGPDNQRFSIVPRQLQTVSVLNRLRIGLQMRNARADAGFQQEREIKLRKG